MMTDISATTLIVEQCTSSYRPSVPVCGDVGVESSARMKCLFFKDGVGLARNRRRAEADVSDMKTGRLEFA